MEVLMMLLPGSIRARALAALVVLAGLAIAAAYWGARSAPERSEACMDDWDVHDLVGYLRGRGLQFHLTPTSSGRNASSNAYLTTEAKPAAELYRLLTTRKAIHIWAGVVYCEVSRRYEDREGVLEMWADCGLRAGPFVFFGDPALLARIRTALEDANGSGTWFLGERSGR
jgi:hypothetical protein